MLTSHEILRVQDLGKKNEVLFEVNWNPKDKRSNESKLVRMTFPNGDVCTIKREELNAILFIIGRPDDQVKMIPKVERRSRWYETVVSVKATKTIQKGEEITFPLKITLPTLEEEVIAEAKRDVLKTKSTGALLGT